jgi:hypothetical protein
MKKIIQFLILFSFTLALFGCNDNNENLNNLNPEDKTDNTKLIETDKNPMITKKGLKCSIEKEENGTYVNIILYVTNQNTRTTNIMKSDVMNYEMNAIVINNKNYIWTNTEEKGTIFQLSEEEITEINNIDFETFESEAVLEGFICEEWNVDNSVFKLPTDIEFKDMTDKLEKLLEMEEMYYNDSFLNE